MDALYADIFVTAISARSPSGRAEERNHYTSYIGADGATATLISPKLCGFAGFNFFLVEKVVRTIRKITRALTEAPDLCVKRESVSSQTLAATAYGHIILTIIMECVTRNIAMLLSVQYCSYVGFLGISA